MNIKQLIDDYASWLKNEIRFEKCGEYYEITTPYLDNANDYLQMYVRQEEEEVFFTDDGAMIQGLKMGGIALSPNRKKQLGRILFQYGVKLEGEVLTAKASIKDFPRKKHMFVQAMLRVDDLFSTSKNKEVSYFLDDISEFFLQKEIFYTDNVQFTGISGFSHSYDFILQRSKNKPERFCRAMNHSNKSNMGNIIFAWNDTLPSRQKDSQLIVFLNDQNGIAKGVEEAFLNYNARVIRWSAREEESSLSLLSVG